MFLFENPVLQRELLVNLRMRRAFILLMAYVGILGLTVYAAWPRVDKIDMTSPTAARGLVDLFFLGQFLLISLMAPSFAAGAVTGEKERKTYEMLLASPLRPGAIVLGKLLASLCHLVILIVAALPIVMLCLPLGGVSAYEVLAGYLVLLAAAVLFGMISIACSSYFKRTLASLIVSYLLILPLAFVAIGFWVGFSNVGAFRLAVSVTFVPVGCLVLTAMLYAATSRRLLYPPDVGSEGQEVVDLEDEQRHAVGLVIRRDQFPDRLFAPAKRSEPLPDGANPIYDKEIRSEIFSQGTLMLRVVIQVSMLLAIPLMAVFLFIQPWRIPWYIGYVVLFNVLVGPAFFAGAVTGERERQTLELLLTTIISPWQFLWGKLVSGLRVTIVLTFFLLWPGVLAYFMVSDYWNLSMVFAGLAYLLIVATTCVTTATIAMFCSVVFRKTTVALMTGYLLILLLFAAPLGAEGFAQTFFRRQLDENDALGLAVERLTVPSPIATAFAIPIVIRPGADTSRSLALPNPLEDEPGWTKSGWFLFALHIIFTIVFDASLLLGMIWLFKIRWRVTY